MDHPRLARLNAQAAIHDVAHQPHAGTVENLAFLSLVGGLSIRDTAQAELSCKPLVSLSAHTPLENVYIDVPESNPGVAPCAVLLPAPGRGVVDTPERKRLAHLDGLPPVDDSIGSRCLCKVDGHAVNVGLLIVVARGDRAD